MLDSKRVKGSIKLGANTAAGTIMTHKQGMSVCLLYFNNYYTTG